MGGQLLSWDKAQPWWSYARHCAASTHFKVPQGNFNGPALAVVMNQDPLMMFLKESSLIIISYF